MDHINSLQTPPTRSPPPQYFLKILCLKFLEKKKKKESFGKGGIFVIVRVVVEDEVCL